jgi:hypothetical protein
MANGFSLNIGLNSIDTTKYKGKYQPLRNAENDAEYYYQIASQNDFSCIKLLGKDATSINLLDNIKLIADKMAENDLLFISYSGHGTRVKDLNTDEDDGYDEALVLYDRLFIDDEFQLCWNRFKEGVRIFFVNDSCYNGTVSKVFSLHPTTSELLWPDHILRGVDTNESNIDFENNLAYFKSIKLGTDATSVTKAKCSIIHIGSCQDNQLSDDGAITDKNGKFTLAVRKIYDGGNFKGSYKSFFDIVIQEMPPWQTPNWDTDAGKNDDEFIKSSFLKI